MPHFSLVENASLSITPTNLNISSNKLQHISNKMPPKQPAQQNVEQPEPFVLTEVAWKNAKTFNIFQHVWKVGGKPLAERRKDMHGMVYQRCLVPKKGITKLQNRLLKEDKNAVLYMIPT